jgi:hypothetical protein
VAGVIRAELWDRHGVPLRAVTLAADVPEVSMPVPPMGGIYGGFRGEFAVGLPVAPPAPKRYRYVCTLDSGVRVYREVA